MSRSGAVRILAALVAVVAACTGAEPSQPEPVPTSPLPATSPPATTTTEVSLCPASFCLVFGINPEARWSDGSQVTAADFVHTHQAIMAGDPSAGFGGHEAITGIEVLDDKTLLLTFGEVYGPWPSLFPWVLPAHGGVGASVDPAITSGPFLIESESDDRVVLRRHPAYWSPVDPLSGEPLGDVEELHIVVIGSARDRVQGLRDGTVDLVELEPLEWVVAEVEAIDTAEFQVSPGPLWEHIAFNHDDPLLSQLWVREAIALALDRERLLDETVRRVHSEAEALGSALWMVDSFRHGDHFGAAHSHDPEAGEQLLVERGCRRGEDGIYSCQGTRMSFTWGTTAGDPVRERHFELAREDLEMIGIELVPDFRVPAELFSSAVLFGGPEAWQLINFAWRAGDDPHLSRTFFHCTGSAPTGFGRLNVARYCDDRVEGLARSAEATADQEERHRLYDEADRIYMEDLAVIPLYQRPVMLAWSRELSGPRPNASRSGHLWNLPAWAGRESVTMAVESRSPGLHPVAAPDGVSAMIQPALYQGAFGVSPSWQPLPILVERVDVLGPDD